MKIQRRELIDWENIRMTLHSDRDLSDEELARLKHFLETWPEKAPPREIGNSCPIPIWLDAEDRRTLRFYWEKWFAEAWFEPLAQALAAAFPSLALLEIGEDFEPPFRDEEAFIAVPRKVIVLEDGTTHEVEPFEMAKYTVSVAQFERFTQKTAYKTIAEQQDDEETFRDNQFIGDIPAAKRGSLAAFYISYLDALAYCEWAKVRLPTEAEWVAAAAIDDRVCDDDDLGRFQSELRENPAAIVVDSHEMTGSVIDGRWVVVRSGPYLVRCRDDLNSPRYRRRRPINDCEHPIEFRVCK